MCRCPIVVFIYFQDSTLMIFSARPGYVFRNPFLMALTRTSVDGLYIDACKYCASYGFDVCTRMLFVTAASCWVSRGNYHISVLFFLEILLIYCPFFRTDISCLSSVTVHPLSHMNPDETNGAFFIFGKCVSELLVFLDLVVRYVSTPLCSHLVVLL